MFSPKVLDRGNTFEFRVGTGDLNRDAQKPTECEPGDLGLVRGFLEIAKDDSWQESNPSSNLDEFTSHLIKIHSLLSEEGFEFGHRTFYEAIRFSSMLSAAGSDDVMAALDLQIMQKVLPKLHGSRRKLEGLLCSVGKFCFSLETDGDGGIGSRFDPEKQDTENAKLPISFDKVKRMTRSLRANQFTSFTE
jgi:5-methylcytosine-specific restriction protein B